jgi:hypothetical protein
VKLIPYLHAMPRVKRDIKRCLDFVARQPWGRTNERLLDIDRGIEKALLRPEANRVEAWRPLTGLELRRCNTAQFAIVYAYLQPTEQFPRGVVSIRAVRHSRERNVFAGVKEPEPRSWGPESRSAGGAAAARLEGESATPAQHLFQLARQRLEEE